MRKVPMLAVPTLPKPSCLHSLVGQSHFPRKAAQQRGGVHSGTQDSRLHRVRRWWVLESGLRFRKCHQRMPPCDVCPSHTTRLGWFSPLGPKPPNTSVTQEGNSQQGKDTGKAPRRSTLSTPEPDCHRWRPRPTPRHTWGSHHRMPQPWKGTLRTGTLATAPGQPAALLPRLPTPCPLHAIFRFPTHPLPEYFSPQSNLCLCSSDLISH